jgi:hypothetical protein
MKPVPQAVVERSMWGSSSDRLEKIKRRIDPRNVMVCDWYVGSNTIDESRLT